MEDIYDAVRGNDAALLTDRMKLLNAAELRRPLAEQHTSITNSNRWTSIIYNKINCLHSSLGRPRFRFGLVVMELKSLMTAEVAPLARFPARRGG